jgi:hypothetical protein
MFQVDASSAQDTFRCQRLLPPPVFSRQASPGGDPITSDKPLSNRPSCSRLSSLWL